jgi:FtsP/CotA-like multicopper oxidase with cupredoxin domain
MAESDLHRGTYTGQHAPVYIEPRPGGLSLDPRMGTILYDGGNGRRGRKRRDAKESGGKCQSGPIRRAKTEWLGGGYRLFSINGHALGHGEPVRVRQGQRIMFHVLNASATENTKLALPGHRFLVVALDGNPVPTPKTVDILQLSTAERIDAVVEMNNPGVWILGTPKDDDRKDGMGIVVEYAGSGGEAQWAAPPKSVWDYTIFGGDQPARNPDHVIPMVIGKINGGKRGIDRWTINGKAYDEQEAPTKLQKGLRYRLAFENRSDDSHPLHLHRNIFELTSVDGKMTNGVMKDVVLIKGFGQINDFTADQPGLTLFHCHQQLHMSYGFMKLFNVV